MNETLCFETEILYRGNEIKGDSMLPDSPAIYPATAYVMEDTEHYHNTNSGKGGYLYGRSGNPNRDSLSEVISFMENGEQSLICSSGMAAISSTLLTFAKSGSHILASKSIYGETIELFHHLLMGFGTETTLVDFCNLDEVKSAIRPNTSIFYSEIIANPLMTVVDIEALSVLAKTSGALLIIDSTFSTPFVIKPLDFGADIVIHSLTKFFGGHSDITAGSITASAELIKKIFSTQLLLGSCSDANTAWLALRSVRTMGLRMKKQLSNAQVLAEALDKMPQVKKVNFPGLKTHPQHTLANRIFSEGYGAMISFCVEDNLDKVNDFMHRLSLVKYLGTLGGYRTSIAHPATGFKNDFTQQQLLDMGMNAGLIRISTGIEEVEDLISDFANALKAFD